MSTTTSPQLQTTYPPWDPSKTPYPNIRRDDSVQDTYESATKGNVIVKDPYRWLETPPRENKQTEEFVNTQAKFTDAYLSEVHDRDLVKDKLTQAWNYPRFSALGLRNDGYYYFGFNTGLQAQSVYYRVKKGEEEKRLEKDGPEAPGGDVWFDPNVLSKDGTVAIGSSGTSRSGKYWAYAVSRSGSDWSTIYVRLSSSPLTPSTDPNAKPGDRDYLPKDILRFVKFSSIAWYGDDGFFYQRFPQRAEHGEEGSGAEVKEQGEKEDTEGTGTDKDEHAKLYYHKLGTEQSEDKVIVYDAEQPKYMYSASVSQDDKYVYLYTSKDTGKSNLLWVANLSKWDASQGGEGLKWQKIVNKWGNSYGVITHDDTLHYLETNSDNSPRNKVVTFDLAKPDEGFKTLIPEDPSAVLVNAHPVQNLLVVQFSRDVKDEVHLYELQTGKHISRIAEDLVGSISGAGGKREHDEFWIHFSGFTSPGNVYRYRLPRKYVTLEKTLEKLRIEGWEGKEEEKEGLSLFRATKLKGLDPEEFVSEQVFYESKDGTKVPMFITRLKDTKIDGTAPVIQYGYGGFAITIAPFFSPSYMTWVKLYGGILVVPSLRGGDEYGEDWHLAGCFDKKQNVFDDMIYASKYLIDHNYTSKGKITLSGGSNGGLLCAAVANQAPELYGAAIPEVGVLDMLRFHRFTIGHAWTADYGCSDDPKGFDYLYAYSPIHNVRDDVEYPAVMLMTADHDDRVVPLHSFKHIAALQHARPDNKQPLLIRIDLKSGHGAGKSTEKRIKESADKFAFIARALGLSIKE